MTGDRHERVCGLFFAARRLAPGERAELLNAACGADGSLRTEVEELLTYDDAPETFLEQPALGGLNLAAVAASGQPIVEPTSSADGSASGLEAGPRRLPSSIGAFEIVGLLGEGGMGVVYHARQLTPRRSVALKVLRSDYVSAAAVRRFEHEAQTLARLSHPGIAQIFEFGVAEGGGGRQAYFAMELIEGVTLCEYARRERLTPRQCVELMIRVVDSVQHAHQKGVIHRDLKPGNILVDAAGRPKIVDFGVARLVDADAPMTALTSAGQLIGTLAYMSPEQVSGRGDEIDTRSDVYALGLLLFELLAGRPAFDLREKSLPDATRVVREEEPARLSAINRTFRGDVETIVLKALEKDRDRRYASAAEFAADLRRYLAHEPILAHPPSRLYQLSKFARRHRTLAAGIAVAFVALVGGTLTATWQARRARTEAAKALAVSDFLREMIASADAYGGGRNLRILDTVDRVESEVEKRFGHDPLLAAAMRHEIGSIYYSLGVWEKADEHLSAALAVRRDALGESHRDTLASKSRVGLLRTRQGRVAEAEPLLRDVYETRRASLGESHIEALNAANDLAAALQPLKKLEEAEQLLRGALMRQESELGPDHENTLATAVNLASVLRERAGAGASAGPNDADEAERLYVRAVAGLRRTRGDRHPATLLAISNLARLLKDRGRLADSEPLYREALAGLRQALGPNHPETLVAMANLGRALLSRRKLDEAESLYRDAYARFRDVFGDGHASTATVAAQFGLVLKERGMRDEARDVLTRALKDYRRIYGPEHPKSREIAAHIESLESMP